MATVYYTASSLDGFIATTDHQLDWLVSQDIDPAGPMNYDEFIGRVGAVAMGASTYQWLLEHNKGPWPYRQPSWVFTHRDFPPPGGDVTFTRDDVAAVHPAMVEAAGGLDVWVVGGGDLAGQFHDAGLLDELLVSYAPVTLGSGAPLLPRRVDLTLKEVARNRAFACAHYDVTR